MQEWKIKIMANEREYSEKCVVLPRAPCCVGSSR
jgi:hypothetical protein